MAQPPVIYPANTTPPKKGLNYVWNWLGSSLKSFATALSPYLTSGGVIVTNYPEVVALMSSGSLVKGATYKIGGFNKNMPIGPLNPNGYLPEVLYDDGTNSGITIIMQALTGSELATSGYGEFYNPKYGDETTYNNTDGTGLYRIWDGNNPDPLNVPAYQVDDVVFWGGYAWKNLLGNVGSAVDVFNLDPTEWEKLPYSNSTWYELVVDEIKVDWNNGILVERYNPENQIRVAFNADQYNWYMGFSNFTSTSSSPISAMAWGLYSKITPEQLNGDFYGISNINVINSWCETVSFKGVGFLNIQMNDSIMNDNYIGKNCFIETQKLYNYSIISNNTLDNSSSNNNTLDGGNIYNNLLDDSSINNNTLDNSIILNSLLDSSSIYKNKLDDSSINNNTLDNSSTIDNNTLDSSNINDNTLDGGSRITDNTLIASTFDFSASGTISSSTLTNLYAQSVNANVDLSSASVIFLAGTTKNLITDGSNNPKMTYIDGSGNLQVVAINV